MTTTRDFAVKFGRNPDMGLEGQKAFPFFYTFINSSDSQWTPRGTLTSQADAIDNLVEGVGPLVPANSRITKNVMLDADYIFKLLSVRYQVYYAKPNTVLADGYHWYDPASLVALQSDGQDPDMNKIGTPLSQYISMTLSVSGSGSSVILYGGDDLNPVPRMINGSRREPLPMQSIQGYDYGYLTARTPHLIAQQACLVFDISNTHPTYDLVVGAAIYGLKIRM